jgi:hypothetical protein
MFVESSELVINVVDDVDPHGRFNDAPIALELLGRILLQIMSNS